MFKPVPVGNRTRYSYARINEVLPMPHLIDIQRKSYEWFMREGLCEIFQFSMTFLLLKILQVI